jgi:hypothetical protein
MKIIKFKKYIKPIVFFLIVVANIGILLLIKKHIDIISDNERLVKERQLCIERAEFYQKEIDIQKLTIGKVYHFTMYDIHSFRKIHENNNPIIIITVSQSLLSNQFRRTIELIDGFKKGHGQLVNIKLGVICKPINDLDIKYLIQTIPTQGLDFVAFWNNENPFNTIINDESICLFINENHRCNFAYFMEEDNVLNDQDNMKIIENYLDNQ